MSQTKRSSIILPGLAACALVFLAGCGAPAPKVEPRADSPWEADIRAFEAEAQPPGGGIIFVGSSSIRLWDLKESFPDLPVVRRGFGGSQMADSVRYADRIVVPARPRVVVLYAGDNDIASGKSPEAVAGDFERFVGAVRKALPETRIVYVSIKPSIQRWHLAEAMRKANALIQAIVEKDPSLRFVDVWPDMLGEDGKPRPELLAKDGLHLSAEGYRVWTRLLLPHLSPSEPPRD